MKIAIVLLGFMSIGLISAQAQPGPPAGFSRVPPVKSPEITADGSVTVRLRAPQAQAVAVSGLGTRLDMQKDEAGVWSATVPALKPDIYMYQFSVDGATFNDPSNPHLGTSFGTGGRSVLTVPGTAPWTNLGDAPHGNISEVRFHSGTIGDDRAFFVYTPPNYDAKRKEPYPVLYLLHGLGDDAQSWITQGGANVTMDNLIAQGRAVPMVVVTPLGYGTANGGQGPRDMLNIFRKTLLDEVMPRVESGFNVSRDRKDHAIAGLSMGGAEATLVGLNDLSRFSYIGSFSGAYVMWPGANAPRGGAPSPVSAPQGSRGADGNAPTATPPAIAPNPGAQAETGARLTATAAPSRPGLDPTIIDTNFAKLDATANGRIKLLYIVCGTDDGLIGVNRQFKTWLTAHNIHFEEQEVPKMAHVWPLWRQNLADFVPMLFKKS